MTLYFQLASRLSSFVIIVLLGAQNANSFSRNHACFTTHLVARLSSQHQQEEEEGQIIISEEAYCPLPTILPLFPLRKSVKLPTETLNLNLYEPRYLAMCDYILNKHNKQSKNEPAAPVIFGAVYGSDKPQIVKGGNGPIVPLYEPGDIGTLFVVQHAEEGVRPSTGGRRIQIRGLAVGRFRVSRIWHNGYGGGEATPSEKGEEEALPFILVEPERVRDNPVSIQPGSDEGQRFLEMEQRIQELMKQGTASILLEGNDSNSDETDAINGDEKDGDTSRASTVDGETTPLPDTHANVRLSTMDFLQDKDVQDATKCNGAKVESSKLQELFSFAAILTLVPERSPQDMLKVLQMTSTLERLEYLERELMA